MIARALIGQKPKRSKMGGSVEWQRMNESLLEPEFRNRLIAETHAQVDKIRAEQGLPPFDWEKTRKLTDKGGMRRRWAKVKAAAAGR